MRKKLLSLFLQGFAIGVGMFLFFWMIPHLEDPIFSGIIAGSITCLHLFLFAYAIEENDLRVFSFIALHALLLPVIKTLGTTWLFGMEIQEPLAFYFPCCLLCAALLYLAGGFVYLVIRWIPNRKNSTELLTDKNIQLAYRGSAALLTFFWFWFFQ